MSDIISRRSFLRAGAAAALGLSVEPEKIVAKERKRRRSSNDRLNILAVGAGGRGAEDLFELESENIIGLCDIDWERARNAFARYPGAKRYNDYRRMFDELLPEADAVLVATPDHTHAVIAADAITAGKDVYCETPLAHSIYESRLLTKLAAKHSVATQMGNQGASGRGFRRICSIIRSGAIGSVTRVEAFSDRTSSVHGLDRPEVCAPSATLLWDSFVGPAAFRPYDGAYIRDWSRWWDFGAGTLGQMGCNILFPAFKALDLGSPERLDACSTGLTSECAPAAQIVRMHFPARDNMPMVAMPAVELVWYDGGLTPRRPGGLRPGQRLGSGGGGLIFHGSKDTLICGAYGERPYLVSGREPSVPDTMEEVVISHQMDWVRACKEYPEYRTPCASDFAEAGPLNEMVMAAVIAVRLKDLGQELEWDGPGMRFTNLPREAEAVASEMIRHTYREGWKLPDMPE